MTDDLKPCPFCGTDELLSICHDLVTGGVLPYSVECITCFTHGPSAKDIDNAIKVWNNRIPLDSVKTPGGGE